MATTLGPQQVGTQQVAGAAARTRTGVAGRRGVNWTAYLFILPHFVFFAIFVLFPLVFGLYISLFDYNFLRPEANKFVGLGN